MTLNSSNVNDDVKMPQIVQKGGSDFWMPAVNTKLKYANQSVTAAATAPQECQEGTQALKSLLGLAAAPKQPLINAGKPQV